MKEDKLPWVITVPAQKMLKGKDEQGKDEQGKDKLRKDKKDINHKLLNNMVHYLNEMYPNPKEENKKQRRYQKFHGFTLGNYLINKSDKQYRGKRKWKYKWFYGFFYVLRIVWIICLVCLAEYKTPLLLKTAATSQKYWVTIKILMAFYYLIILVVELVAIHYLYIIFLLVFFEILGEKYL